MKQKDLEAGEKLNHSISSLKNVLVLHKDENYQKWIGRTLFDYLPNLEVQIKHRIAELEAEFEKL